MTPEERAEKRYPCPQDAQSLILVVRGALQEGCATTIREEVEPLEAENAKLRALVQGILDLSFHDSGCNSERFGIKCDCMKSIIDERAKDQFLQLIQALP